MMMGLLDVQCIRMPRPEKGDIAIQCAIKNAAVLNQPAPWTLERTLLARVADLVSPCEGSEETRVGELFDGLFACRGADA